MGKSRSIPLGDWIDDRVPLSSIVACEQLARVGSSPWSHGRSVGPGWEDGRCAPRRGRSLRFQPWERYRPVLIVIVVIIIFDIVVIERDCPQARWEHSAQQIGNERMIGEISSSCMQTWPCNESVFGPVALSWRSGRCSRR
jgi:hypothetical protein